MPIELISHVRALSYPCKREEMPPLKGVDSHDDHKDDEEDSRRRPRRRARLWCRRRGGGLSKRAECAVARHADSVYHSGRQRRDAAARMGRQAQA